MPNGRSKDMKVSVVYCVFKIRIIISLLLVFVESLRKNCRTIPMLSVSLVDAKDVPVAIDFILLSLLSLLLHIITYYSYY